MASVRPIPESYYYSGQGRLGVGSRNSTTGELSGLTFVGNVTSLSIDVSVTKFEHKESMTGVRGIDLTIIQEQNATFSFSAESLNLELLAQGLYGGTGSVASGTATGEIHFAEKGKAFALAHPGLTAITSMKAVADNATLQEGIDYQVDLGFGTVYILAGSTVVNSGGENVTVTYTHAAYDKIEAFTTGTPPEKWVRFEGLNTINGDLRVIDIYRGAFEPLTGLEFINEELGKGDFKGNILPDKTITGTGLSQYFRERRVAAANVFV